jgi:hypothetical protein
MENLINSIRNTITDILIENIMSKKENYTLIFNLEQINNTFEKINNIMFNISVINDDRERTQVFINNRLIIKTKLNIVELNHLKKYHNKYLEKISSP